MYKAKLVKHVCKDMQLTDEKGKIVFKASVNVAVDDYLNNIPALTRSIKEVTDKTENMKKSLAGATQENVVEVMQAMSNLSHEITGYINTYLVTIFGAPKAHELLQACDNRALDAYCTVVPFVNECIAPEIQNEMNKNMARITDIMK